MERTNVDSTSLSAVGYEPETGTLEIEFNSGSVYQYFNVPEEIYLNLLEAESKGRFFQTDIRNIYAYEMVG